MELRKSIFFLRSKKPNFYVAAFHHKLAFGPVSGEPEVFELQSFQVDYCDYHKIYIDFFQIVKYFLWKPLKKHIYEDVDFFSI